MGTTGLLPALFSILFSSLGAAAESQSDEPIVIGKLTGFYSDVLDEWRPELSKT
jgi:hypothetical protein